MKVISKTGNFYVVEAQSMWDAHVLEVGFTKGKPVQMPSHGQWFGSEYGYEDMGDEPEFVKVPVATWTAISVALHSIEKTAIHATAEVDHV